MKKALPVDLLTGYRRLFGFPLDEDSVKYSLEDAQKYARSSRSYDGQIITVVTKDEHDQNVVVPYKIVNKELESFFSDYYTIQDIINKHYITSEGVSIVYHPADNESAKIQMIFSATDSINESVSLLIKFDAIDFELVDGKIKLLDSVRAKINQVPTNTTNIAQAQRDIITNAQNISAEANRALDAEAALDSKIDGEISDRQTDVSNLTTTINTKESALSARIDALDQKIDDEIDETGDDFTERLSELNSKIDAETARAQAEEEGIQSQLDQHDLDITALENKDTSLDSDIAAVNARIDTTNANLGTETTRATTAEGALSDRITANLNSITDTNSNLAQEISRATGKEAEIAGNLTTETTRATTAETALGGRIDTVNSTAFFSTDVSTTKEEIEFYNNAGTKIATIALKDLGLVLDSNSTNGIIYLKDSKGNIITQTDTVEEKILKSATFNEQTEKLVLTFYDDSVVEIPLSSMTNKIKYYYGDGSTIVLNQVVTNGETQNVFSVSDAYKALIAKITPTETRVGTLETGLQTEATTRGTEITRVEGLISTEAGAREQGDATLQSNINSLEGRAVLDADIVYDSNGRVSAIKDGSNAAKTIVADRAINDSTGAAITTTYLHAAGDTFTGDLTSSTAGVNASYFVASDRVQTSFITSTNSNSDKTHSLEIKSNWDFNEVTGIYNFNYTNIAENNTIFKLSPTELVYKGGTSELTELFKVTSSHIQYKGSELALDSKFSQYVTLTAYDAGMATKQDNLTGGAGIDITNNVVSTANKASVLIVERSKINTVDYFAILSGIISKNGDFPIILLKTTTSSGDGYLVFTITSTSSELIVASSFTEYTDNATSTVLTTTLSISVSKESSSVTESLKEVYTKASVDTIKTNLETYIATKQNNLTAGSNITISGAVISAVDTTYEQASNSVVGINKFYDNSHKGEMTADDGAISPLGVKNYVLGLNYITADYLSDPNHVYATRQWVVDQAYLQSVPVQYKTQAENDLRYLQLGQTPEHGVTTNTQQNILAEKSFSGGLSITSGNSTETMGSSNKVKMMYNADKKCLVFKFN